MSKSKLVRRLRPAVFLDRDGTINVEKDYLYRVEDFEFIPGATQAIKLLNDHGFLVVVVTNQSGVARGYYTCNDVEKLHGHIQSQLQQHHAHVDRYYYCPHHPTDGLGKYRVECGCRKGRSGMLLQAAKDMQIELRQSFMVGDKLADVEASLGAGCKPLLVRTGYGARTLADGGIDKVPVLKDLLAAARWICEYFPQGIDTYNAR